MKDNVSIGVNSLGCYKNDKGKEVYNKKLNLKIYETQTRGLTNTPLFYANFYKVKSLYYLKSTAVSKLRCDLRDCRIRKIKTKLKIDEIEVKNWTSSNTKVATITSTGKLKTLSEGTTILTATLKDGSTYQRKLKVKI